MPMVMISDETQIQIFATWPMSRAKRVTRDKRKNPEYHVVAAIRKLRTVLFEMIVDLASTPMN